MSEKSDQIIESAVATVIKSQRLQNEILTGEISNEVREALRFDAISKLIKDLSEETGKGELKCAITIMTNTHHYSEMLSIADKQIDTFLSLVKKKMDEVRSE